MSIGLDGQDVAANAHDGMWALALGLNSSVEELKPKRLESYVYGDFEMAAIFERHIRMVQFYGVSVRYQRRIPASPSKKTKNKTTTKRKHKQTKG